MLHELLERREELAAGLDEDRDPVVFPDYAALFHGRAATQAPSITIGPGSGVDALRIEVSAPGEWSPEQKDLFTEISAETDVQALRIVHRDKERLLPPWFLPVSDRRAHWSRHRYARMLRRGLLEEEGEWPVIECESIGPGLMSNSKLAQFWDNVALTDEEDLSIKALQLTGEKIDRVAVVGDDDPRYRGDGRRVVVKLQGHSRPVPLKSLGDGVTRMFAVGLALAHSRNGFLVIDEAENGLHYSVQRDFWRMVLQAARQHDVQVLATTHSWDCVKGFARAAADVADVEGVLVRLEQDGEDVRAVEYAEEDLETAADQNIEVR